MKLVFLLFTSLILFNFCPKSKLAIPIKFDESQRFETTFLEYHVDATSKFNIYRKSTEFTTSRIIHESPHIGQPRLLGVYNFNIIFVILLASLLIFVFTSIFKKTARYNKNFIKNIDQEADLNKQKRIYFLFLGIIFPLTETYVEIFKVRNQSELVSSYVLGFILIFLYFYCKKNKWVYKNLHKIFVSLYISYLAYLLYKTTALPFDLATFSEIMMGIFFSYSLLRTIKEFWTLIFSMSIYFFCLYFFKVITIQHLVLYQNLLLVISLICYTRHISLLNSNDKYIFASNVINEGNSLVLAADKMGEISFCSQTVKKILGYDVEDVLGKGFRLVTEDKEFLLEDYNMSYDKDKVYTRKLKCKSGEYKYIQWKDQKYSADLFVSIGQDVTEQIILQEQYKNLIESATDVVYESDRFGNFTFLNPISEKILGYNSKELVGKHFSYLIRKDFIPVVSEFYVKAAQEGNEFDFLEFPIIRKDGAEIWISQKVTTKRNDADKIIGYSAFARDITHKKYTEDALKESEGIFRQINETIEDVFWLYDNISKKYIYISPTCEKFFGVPQKDLYEGTRSAMEFIVLEDKQDIIDLFKKVSVEGTAFETEYRICIDNKIKWIYEKWFAIKNNDEEVIKISGSCSDITKRKDFEESLQESENNFRQINETIEDVFWLWDIAEEKYIYISPSCIDILGYSQEALYVSTEKVTKQIHPDDLAIYEGAKKKLQYVDSYEIEYRLILEDGSVKWISEKSVAIRNEQGEAIRNSGICTDITERKRIDLEIKQLSIVAEKITNGVLIANESGSALWANQGYLDMFEIPLYELLGKNPNDLFSPVNNGLLGEVDKMNATDFSMEINITTFKGNNKWFEINNTVIKEKNGKTLQQIEILHDITERILNEQKIESQSVILKKYSKELEYKNELKEKLIYASTLEQVTVNALGFIASQLSNSGHIHLLQIDDTDKYLKGYSLIDGKLINENFMVCDLKSYKKCSNGEVYIEGNLTEAEDISISDKKNLKDGVVSYIVVPLILANKFTGVLSIGFSDVFMLDESEVKNLKDAADIIAIALNQINLKTILEEKNYDITSSINYAKNIQNAILPDLKNNFSYLMDVSLVYKPKDIVSGDFYWAKEMDQYTYIAVADCTGHGVPGSFLTLLGNNILEQLVGIEKIISPAEILTKLDEQIFKSLNTNRNELIRDGMEIALCIFDKNKNTVVFSGAGLGLTYFSKGILNNLKGQRKSIGDYRNESFIFEDISLDTNGIQQFYMATDGYQDQLGGEKYRRFSKNNYLELLEKIKNINPEEQEKELNNTIKSYIGKGAQTDDITVIGFKLKSN